MAITLVTAFFNIGREKFKAIPRTNQVYINNFRFWARLNNNIVVYTNSLMAEVVLQIRREFGLENRTKVVVVEDIERIEPDILHKMESIRNNTWFERFRILPNATSNIPRYSYLMLLKTWFLQDAVNRGYASGTLAWFDFGFNHGGKLYTNPQEFDFEWTYEFSDKIHLFFYEKLDTKPIYETVRRLADSIMGCLYIVPDHYSKTLWDLTKNAMLHLLSVDLYDDDQLLLLMAYRSNPDIFELHKSGWFLPLKEYGGTHLTTKPDVKLNPLKVKIKELIAFKKKFTNAFRTCAFTFFDLMNKD